MLKNLFHATLYLWPMIILIVFILLMNTSRYLLTLARLLSTAIALLTCITGLLGLLTQKMVVINISDLFIIFQPSVSLSSTSSFFVFLTGLCYLGISIFSVNYFKHFSPSQQAKIHFLESIFVFSIILVFIGNDTFTFLFAWESMALASYFLVICIEPSKQSRKAGLLYLGIAHIGFFAIATSFYLLSVNSNIPLVHFNELALYLKLSPAIANTIFILSVFGFGAKAGIFPLHVWLPEAHPAAPSPISALMSGVMLTTAIYGLIRFTFDFLLSYQQIWWGYMLIGFGLITMFIGVIHAAMQTDMKRLLAYSSMENMGFIVMVLGLAIAFYQYHLYPLSSLALLVVLLHSLNHGLFKSVLFLGTGSILHATGEHNLGKLGGLIHKMPWVSACTLIGTLAMAGLPLFSGFISEWLYLSIFFHHHNFPFLIEVLSPLIIALSVLVFGLAGYVVIKFYGIAFLGQPRESKLTHAYPSTYLERIGLAWLAIWCVLLGLWPNLMIHSIQGWIYSFLPKLNPTVKTSPLFLHFSSANTHAFSPLLLGVSLSLLTVTIVILLKRLSPYTIRRGLSWDCGYDELTARMQDTAEGFGQPFKQIFSKLIAVKLKLPKHNDLNPHYHSQLTEKIWKGFYFPLVKITTRISILTKWVQQGRMTAYLLYIGITLLILLVWVVWA